jgi:hypothetical protein
MTPTTTPTTCPSAVTVDAAFLLPFLLLSFDVAVATVSVVTGLVDCYVADNYQCRRHGGYTVNARFVLSSFASTIALFWSALSLSWSTTIFFGVLCM